jgi:hypothetical protein
MERACRGHSELHAAQTLKTSCLSMTKGRTYQDGLDSLHAAQTIALNYAKSAEQCRKSLDEDGVV